MQRRTLADMLPLLSPGLIVAGAADVRVDGVCIDSRQAAPGALFVALRGERADGHDYVAPAFAAGATVALVERAVPATTVVGTVSGTVSATPLRAPVAVVVPQTLAALQRLAQAERRASPALRVVAVTGSVGKTTTKEAIAGVLAERFATLKSSGNQNNEIGLPLTLMALEPQHTHAVLEMGMYALGEIATLCDIAAPQVGVVTNVGPTHLERLGSIERIAQAKAELVAALPPTGTAILNGDDPLVSAMRVLTAAEVISYGLRAGNVVRAVQIESAGWQGVRFTVQVQPHPRWGAGEERTLRIAALGRHMVMAALAAVTVGRLEGVTWEEIQRGLLAQGHGLRLVRKAGPNGSALLDDSYNASPASTCAALEVLAEVPGRHLAVLGDMLELGSEEEAGHREVGRRCAQTVQHLLTVGERAKLIGAAAREAGLPEAAVRHAPDNAAAIALLKALLQEGDTLLIKGSRGMAMEEIVRGLEVKAG